MSIIEVAKLAGVSTATVSRVLNNNPRVAAGTAEAVRRVMEETNFTRQRAPRQAAGRKAQSRRANIGFLVFGSHGSRRGQSGVFEELLRGVSTGATERELGMTFAFVEVDSEVPKGFRHPKVDALLLHGDLPEPAVRGAIEDIPSVWLMANRQRAPWGDQVMPDNTVIGEVAANYLVERGHRRLAFVSRVWWGWFWKLRARAFVNQAVERGAEVVIVPAEPMDWSLEARKPHRTVDELVEQLLKLEPRPTGLFIGEDAQVPDFVEALGRRGVNTGPGADFEIISCNNDASHLRGLGYRPATIDIQAEIIGERGVQLLLSRLDRPNGPRLRELVEPTLVPGSA